MANEVAKVVAKVDIDTQIQALDDILEQKDDIGFTPKLVRVKIDHGSETLTIEGLPAQKRIVALVLVAQKSRVFFPKYADDKETEKLTRFTSNRPFCSSPDCVKGVLAEADWEGEVPEVAEILRDKISEGGLECAKCPLSKWGSVEIVGQMGRGQACKELRRLLLWQKGNTIPMLLSLPTSSINQWDRYCSGLQVARKDFNKVITEISLTHNEAPGRKWSTANFAMEGDRTQDMVIELMTTVNYLGKDQALAMALIEIFKGKVLDNDDYPDVETNGSGSDDHF